MPGFARLLGRGSAVSPGDNGVACENMHFLAGHRGGNFLFSIHPGPIVPGENPTDALPIEKSTAPSRDRLINGPPPNFLRDRNASSFAITICRQMLGPLIGPTRLFAMKIRLVWFDTNVRTASRRYVKAQCSMAEKPNAEHRGAIGATRGDSKISGVAKPFKMRPVRTQRHSVHHQN